MYKERKMMIVFKQIMQLNADSPNTLSIVYLEENVSSIRKTDINCGSVKLNETVAICWGFILLIKPDFISLNLSMIYVKPTHYFLI